jgi:hypothetical protein
MNRKGSFAEKGITPLGVLFIAILILFLLMLFDEGYIVDQACSGTNDIMECALNMLIDVSPQQTAGQGSVTATGVISGEFAGENHRVTVNMTFPLAGGPVTGNFLGDCEGTLSGTYAGGDGGTISGSGHGSCLFVIPASGTFTGSVNTGTRKVNINGTGSAADQDASGSLTLTWNSPDR